MKNFLGDDQGDRFVLLCVDEREADARPLAKLLPLNAHQREERKMQVQRITEDIAAIADRIGVAVIGVVETKVWRSWARAELTLHLLSEEAQSYLQTRDPVVRTLLRLRHSLTGTVNALKAQVEKEPPSE